VVYQAVTASAFAARKRHRPRDVTVGSGPGQWVFFESFDRTSFN
jgi:hypothetical protein